MPDSGQAAQGDTRTFFKAWSSAKAGGLVSTNLVQQMTTLATVYDLPQAFVSELQAEPAGAV